MLTAEQLRELLDYDPNTGEFVWRVATTNCVKAGQRAGSVAALGYVHIGLVGKTFRAHRLAWLYIHGEWPAKDLDHINGDKRDNRIANLRLATRPQNCANMGPHKGNKSGVKGVSWCTRDKRWIAGIRINGKRKHLGSFSSIADAAAVYERAASERFGEFAWKGGPQ
jgi:hypothetical protein